MATLLQDLRYGLRMLAKSPGFTAVAVLSLALGIGANTAIFTLIDAVLLKMLPAKNPKELVLLNWAAKDWRGPMVSSLSGNSNRDNGGMNSTAFSYRSFEHIRSRSQAFSHVFAFVGSVGRVNVIANGETRLAQGQLVSGDYFDGLGIRAILGRTFVESDDQPGAAPVAMISYGYWKRRFGGDPAVVGKAITVNNVPFTIVGVTPAEFFGLSPGGAVEISVPLRTQPLVEPRWGNPGTSLFTATDNWWMEIMGRLKPGISETQARAALDVIYKQSVIEGVTFPKGKPVNIPWIEWTSGSRGLEGLRRQFSKPLFILMTVVGLVLVDLLRQRGELAARARHGAAEGDCGAPLARRASRPLGPTTAH